jgi:NAD(P)-dependent dehydrogenase (short-subunit alcohol dehydrogenase family)
VVTGASSGIGYELAAQFVEHGYDVVVAAEDLAIATAARNLLRDGGPDVRPVRADLATYEGIEELAEAVTNVRSTVHLAKRLLPGMVERGQGRVPDGHELHPARAHGRHPGRPGDKVQTAAGKIVPDRLKAEQHRKVAEPGSGS